MGDVKPKVREGVFLNEFRNVRNVFVDLNDGTIGIFDMDGNNVADCQVSAVYFDDTDVFIEMSSINGMVANLSVISVAFRKPPIVLHLFKFKRGLELHKINKEELDNK